MAKQKKKAGVSHKKKSTRSKSGMGKAKAAAAAVKNRKAATTGRATSTAEKAALKEAQTMEVRGNYWKGEKEGDALVGRLLKTEWGTGKRYKNPQLAFIIATADGTVTFTAAEWLGKRFEEQYPKVKTGDKGNTIAIVYRGEGTRSGKGRAPKIYAISIK